MTSGKAVPTEIRVSKDKRTLTITLEDGKRYELSAEYLRVNSPSAEVQGHSESERKIVGGKKDVEIMSVAPVGRYALRIGFTDLHDTGIFSWEYLVELGVDYEARWQTYLDQLAERGLSRERPGEKPV